MKNLKDITIDDISESMTVAVLTAIYNMHVPTPMQVKKFRTKEQAIDRTMKALAANVVVVPETAELTPEIRPNPEGGFGVLVDYYARPIDGTTPEQPDPVIDQQTEGYIRVIRGEPLPASDPDGDKADLMIADNCVYAQTDRERQEIKASATAEQKPRRKAVKGVAKIAEQLLRPNPTDQSLYETIISVVQRKYIDEGGYSEKDARANAQNILAYVKEKLQKESQVNTEADAQMDAASSAA